MALSQLKDRFLARKTLTTEHFHQWNQGLALFHVVQGALILFLSSTQLFPVQTSYLNADPLASQATGDSVLTTGAHHLFDLNIAYLIAIFFFVSAIAHVLAASFLRKQYEAGLKKGINRLRWIEYAVSESVLLVTIALLAGVTELSLLFAVVACTVALNMVALTMESVNQGKAKPSWLPALTGGIVGAIPFVIIALYLWGSEVYGLGSAPMYLWWLVGSSLVLAAGFPLIMYLQFKKAGAWKDYHRAEIAYMMLNWALKTVVAWQIFAGALRS